MSETIPSIGQAFLSGWVGFISPCLLAILPVLLIHVTGVGMERRRAAQAEGWRLKGSLVLHLASFWLGFTIVLVISAAGHTWPGRLLLTGQRAFTMVGGLLVAAMGLFMSGVLSRASEGDVRLRFRHTSAGYLVSTAIGAVFGLVWSPCVGPVLGSLMLLAGQPDTADMGVPLLVIHALGFGLPLLATGMLFDAALQRIKEPRWIILCEKAAGVVMAALGLLIVSGRFLSFTDGLFQTFDVWVQALIQGGL